MKSLITEISQNVRRTVEQLDKSLDSPECSDKIAEIDKAIEDVREHIEPINSSNSGKLSMVFRQVIDPLKEAKSALKSKGTGGYKTSIWNALELIHHIQNQIPLVLKDDKVKCQR